MKSSVLFFFAVLVIQLGSCGKAFNPDGYIDQPAFDAYNRILEEELKAIPDFSCPPIAVKDFFVLGTPEHVTWFTSEPQDYSSKALKKGGNFYAYLNDIPATFRYVGPGANSETEKLFNTQMPLLWVSLETFEFMPCAATHWAADLESNTAYYKLNENILWSDGIPCTADDWIFACRFLSSKEIIDPLKNRYYKNLTVTKINPYCIAIQYSGYQFKSAYELLEATNIKPIASHFYGGEVPKKWIEKYNRVAEPTTGPYVLTVYDANNGLKFEKVKNWWAHEYPHFKGIANFDAIYYKIIAGSKNPAFRKFDMGMFDVIHIDNTAEWEAARLRKNVQEGFVTVWKGYYMPVNGPAGLFFNTQMPPLNNLFVRQGLYYAIDFDGLIATAFSGERTRMHTLGTGQTWGGAVFNNEAIRKPGFNPKKAMELFAKAGYTKLNSNGILQNENGEELLITVIFRNVQEREFAGYLYSQALLAGVKLDFKYYKGGFTDKIASRDYHAWLGEMPAAQIPNNYLLLHSSYAHKNVFENFFGYSDPELDALLEECESQDLTYTEKAAVNRKIEERVDQAALMVPSYYKNTISIMAWKWICFPAWLNMKYQTSLDDPMFGYMWFDPDIEAECRRAKAENKMLEDKEYALSRRYRQL